MRSLILWSNILRTNWKDRLIRIEGFDSDFEFRGKRAELILMIPLSRLIEVEARVKHLDSILHFVEFMYATICSIALNWINHFFGLICPILNRSCHKFEQESLFQRREANSPDANYLSNRRYTKQKWWSFFYFPRSQAITVSNGDGVRISLSLATHDKVLQEYHTCGLFRMKPILLLRVEYQKYMRMKEFLIRNIP